MKQHISNFCTLGKNKLKSIGLQRGAKLTFYKLGNLNCWEPITSSIGWNQSFNFSLQQTNQLEFKASDKRGWKFACVNKSWIRNKSEGFQCTEDKSQIFHLTPPTSWGTGHRVTKLCQGSGKCERVFKVNGKVVFGGIDLHRITELGFLTFVSTDNPPFSSQ